MSLILPLLLAGKQNSARGTGQDLTPVPTPVPRACNWFPNLKKIYDLNIGWNMKSNKALLAYAVFSSISNDPADVISGFLPVFKTAANKCTKNLFDASEFSLIIKEYFGILVHPWALEGLADKLSEMKILKKIKVPGKGQDYYEVVKQEDRELIKEDNEKDEELFVEFQKFVSDYGYLIDREDLDQVLVDFILEQATVLDDEREEKEVLVGEGVDIEQNKDGSNDKYFVLAAAFVVHLESYRADLYKKIESVCRGALLAEAVLHFQNNGAEISLVGNSYYLDAPVALAYMDLAEPAESSATKFVLEKIKELRGFLYIYEHTEEEMLKILGATLDEYRQGKSKGPLARRMVADSSHFAYATNCHMRLREKLKALGVAVKAAPVPRLATASDEQCWGEFLRYSQGSADAKEYDLKSLRSMRNYDSEKVELKRFHVKKNLMLTFNGRVTSAARKTQEEQRYMPSIITVRSLTVMLWITFGGEVNSRVAKYQLVSRCSKALEPGSVLLSKVKNFLNKVDPSKVPDFEALMTNDRAAHALTIRTIGNPERVENIQNLVDQIIDDAVSEKTNEFSQKEEGYKAEISSLKVSVDQMLERESARLARHEKSARSSAKRIYFELEIMFAILVSLGIWQNEIGSFLFTVSGVLISTSLLSRWKKGLKVWLEGRIYLLVRSSDLKDANS